MKLRPCFLILMLSLAISIYARERPVTETYMVEMRDGIKLATQVYLPYEGEGPWPVILARTQYNRSDWRLEFTASVYGRLHLESRDEDVLSKGIVSVIQNIRGTADSEGQYDMIASSGWGEKQDGYDTVEWILAQPWCNGKIMTYGRSAVGVTQILLAGTGPQGIVGQIIDVASIGNDRVYYTGGVLRKLFVETIASRYKDKEQSVNTVRSHYFYDQYWKTQNLSERVDRVNWPVVLKTGWYDFCQQGAIDAFNAIQAHGGPNARDNVHLLIGPWGINGSSGTFTYSQEILEDAWPYEEIDYWLLDTPAPGNIPTVKYFTMGENPPGNSPGNEWKTTIPGRRKIFH